jgi:hypothetical protein
VYTHILPSQKKIHLYRLSGSDLTPSYGWVDDTFEFIGFVSEWFSLLREDVQHEKNKLLEIQKPFQASYFRKLKRSLTQSSAKIIITHANIFDPENRTLVPDQTILIENGIIKEVSRKTYKLGKDYRVIDATGKFVMPGLWDMHVHFNKDGADGIINVACGVTNVRDMGNSDDLLIAKKEIADGNLIGPRIQMMCGFIDGAGPYSGPIGSKINSSDEGIEAVRKYAGLGYQQIKLYSSLKPEWVKPIAAEAKKYKLRVSGHIPAHMLATEAVESGYDEIQHMNMIFLNFYGKTVDTRTPLRFSTVAQKAAFFNFENEEYKSFIRQLKQKNIAVDPTVSIFERMFTQEEGKPSTSMAPIVHRLPVTLQRSLRSASGLSVPLGLEETYRNSFANMLKMVKALYDAGILIIPGTDDFAGFILHRELENYVKAGIPSAEVLRMATLTSATIANLSAQFGSISPNKAADILIIDGDPLKNISDIRKVTMVVQDTNVYETSALFEAVSIKPNK